VVAVKLWRPGPGQKGRDEALRREAAARRPACPRGPLEICTWALLAHPLRVTGPDHPGSSQ